MWKNSASQPQRQSSRGYSSPIVGVWRFFANYHSGLFLALGVVIISRYAERGFRQEVLSQTDVELLRLAMDSEQLTSEAKASLTSEFAKRGISAEQIRVFREEEELRGIATHERPEPVASSPMVLESYPYTIGRPLPSETAKAPWRPKAAGRIAFFFGPFAGALVVVISLRRMGHQQSAKKVMLLALGAAATEMVILFLVPDVLSRLVGFGAEIVFLLIFPVFMEKEFSEWQATHPNTLPSNGWNAIGWGLVGTVVFFVIAIFVFAVLSALVPVSQ